MIVAYSFVPVSDERAGKEFAGAMARRSRAVEAFPGFVRFEFRARIEYMPTWMELGRGVRPSPSRSRMRTPPRTCAQPCGNRGGERRPPLRR